MNMAEIYPLTEEQVDKLRTIFTEGMQHVNKSLSEMVKRRISLVLAQVKLLPIEEVPTLVGEKKILINGVYLHFSGVLTGSVLLYFPQESALLLSDLLFERKLGETTKIHDLEQSALKEVGNIFTNAYVDILAKIIGMKILPSVPYFVRDMLGAVVEDIIVNYAQASVYVLLVDTNFELPGTIVKGHFLLFSPPETLELLLKRLARS